MQIQWIKILFIFPGKNELAPYFLRLKSVEKKREMFFQDKPEFG